MNPQYINDTITAISSPHGQGAISIIRISGDSACDIASKIFYNPKVNLYKSNSHVLHYGKIVDPITKDLIDEVLLCVMRSNRSFTGEELIEINCHGGEVIPYTVLKLLLSMGARLAEHGEFTRRAYLNGKIDLTQAEAINDIITSQNLFSSKMAMSNLEKRFSNLIKGFKADLIRVLALLEVNIDYPEEDIEPVDHKEITLSISKIIDSINKIITESKSGRILKQGVKITIVGKTNTGKSSLFNYMVREEKAIVSHIHGTTRDFLETHISLADIPIHLVDTAGFRHTENEIEKIGKNRSKKMMSEADYILWLLDSGRQWDHDDESILKSINKDKVIIILNKADLDKKIDENTVLNKFDPKGIFTISLLKETGLDNMEKGLRSIFLGETLTFNNQSIMCNIRQESLLLKARASFKKALTALSDGLSYEFIAIELREGLDHLSEIIGQVNTDDILNEIFQNFCIGK